MHELLRQYAAEKLDLVPQEQEEVRDRHCRYFAAFLQQRKVQLRGTKQMQVLGEIGQEIRNAQVAWRWAVIQGKVAEIGQAAGSLYRYCDMRSRFQEAEEAFGRAVAMLEPTSDRDPELAEEADLVLGMMLAFQGYFAHRLYLDAKARRLLERSLRVLRPLGAREELALANLLAVYAKAYAKTPSGFAEVENLARHSLAIYQELGDRSGTAHALFVLGLAAWLDRGDHHEAARLIQESININRENGNRWGAAFALFELGEVTHSLGAHSEARGHYRESLEMRRQIGDRWGMALCLDHVGYVTREMGEYDEAWQLHQESLTISREIGDQLRIAGSLDNLGLVAYELEHFEEARQYLQEGLAIRSAIGRQRDVGISLQHLGHVALGLGDYDEARQKYQQSLEVHERLQWHQGKAIDRSGGRDPTSA